MRSFFTIFIPLGFFVISLLTVLLTPVYLTRELKNETVFSQAQSTTIHSETTIFTNATLTTASTTTKVAEPCSVLCFNRAKCKIIIGDVALEPDQGRYYGTIDAEKQFRFAVEIDFPIEAAFRKFNIIHVRT